MIYPLLPVFLQATLGAPPAPSARSRGRRSRRRRCSSSRAGGGRTACRAASRSSSPATCIASIARPLVALAAAPAHVLAVASSTASGRASARRRATRCSPTRWTRRCAGVRSASTAPRTTPGPWSGRSSRSPARGRGAADPHGVLARRGAGALAVLDARRRGARSRSARARRPGARAAMRRRERRASALPPPPLAAAARFSDVPLRGRAVHARQLDRRVPAAPRARARRPDRAAADAVGRVPRREVGVEHAGRRALGPRGPQAAIVAGWALYAAVYSASARASEAWHAWALFGGYGVFFGLTEGRRRRSSPTSCPRAARRRSAGTISSVGLGRAAGVAAVRRRLGPRGRAGGVRGRGRPGGGCGGRAGGGDPARSPDDGVRSHVRDPHWGGSGFASSPRTTMTSWRGCWPIGRSCDITRGRSRGRSRWRGSSDSGCAMPATVTAYGWRSGTDGSGPVGQVGLAMQPVGGGASAELGYICCTKRVGAPATRRKLRARCGTGRSGWRVRARGLTDPSWEPAVAGRGVPRGDDALEGRGARGVGAFGVCLRCGREPGVDGKR